MINLDGDVDVDAVRAVIDVLPQAFAALDTEQRVLLWNPAAEGLTGFSRAEVIGQPLPHLTAAQREGTASFLPRYDDVADDVPRVMRWRHASGRAVQICITGHVRLRHADGSLAGHGSFFRAVRPSDTPTNARNAYSQGLAASVRAEDAMQALATVIQELLPGDRGYLLRRTDDGWRGWLAAGDHREVAEGIAPVYPTQLDEALRDGRCRSATLHIAGRPAEVLVVPAGPTSGQTVLVLLPDVADVVDEVTHELAVAIAAEAWATLRRVEALDELEDKVEILEAIAGVVTSAGLEVAEVAAHVTDHACDSLQCERAALYLVDSADGRLLLAAFHAADGWTAAEGEEEAGTAAAAEMLRRGGLVCQDTTSRTWLAGPWASEDGAVSVLAVPLSIGGEDIGLLVVAHSAARPRGFTTRSTQLAEALAGQAALAIANARLYDAQRTAAERFRTLDRQRADYVAGITHDLRSPVTAILGFARTLSRAGDQLTPEERREAVDTIERQSLRISRMLGDMLDSARAEAGQLVPNRRIPVPLHGVVREAAMTSGPDQRNRVDVRLDTAVTVCGDADQLTRVVQNLLVNALQYAPAGSPVVVTVDADASHATLQVIDSGPGIPTDLDAFTRFGRGDTRGTGLGLYTVKQIVELHDGSIDLAATPGGGTTVTVHLPLHDPAKGC